MTRGAFPVLTRDLSSWYVTSRTHGHQAQLTHQSADQLGRAPLAAAQQRGVQAPIPVLAVVCLKQSPDLDFQQLPSFRRF